MKFSHCECARSQCSFDIFDDYKPLSTTKGWNSLESPWVDSDCVTFNQMASSNVQQYLLVRTLTCVVSLWPPCATSTWMLHFVHYSVLCTVCVCTLCLFCLVMAGTVLHVLCLEAKLLQHCQTLLGMLATTLSWRG